jgi:hypothetical protein
LLKLKSLQDGCITESANNKSKRLAKMVSAISLTWCRGFGAGAYRQICFLQALNVCLAPEATEVIKDGMC